MFIRAKKVKGRVYYQLVQGYRDFVGKVRQRTIASLGTSPTVEDAIKAAKRELSGIRRQRGRYVGSYGSKTIAAKIARLDRQEAAAVARLELLESALTKLHSVDTTERVASEPQPKPWPDVREAYEFGKRFNAEHPSMAIVHAMMCHYLIVHAPEVMLSLKPGDDLVAAFRKAKGLPVVSTE
jgi:hypothetical protein